MAPQYAGLLAPVSARQLGTVVGNEDCLTLNIFAPGEASTARAGTSATYDVARNYAAHDGIVVVSLNYRLGVLGWFCHPALIEADQATPEERSGNFGTLDLIAALRWVRKNIAAFGGDPDCVTIFGESAGAQNVLTLLASPLAAGLFHRTIAQSPVVDTFDVCEATERNTSPLESFRTSSCEIAGWPRGGKPTWMRPTARCNACQRQKSPRFLSKPVPPECISPRVPFATASSCRNSRFPTSSGRVHGIACPSSSAATATNIGPSSPTSRSMRGFCQASYPCSATAPSTSASPASCRSFGAPSMSMSLPTPLFASGHSEVWTYQFDWDEAPAVPVLRPDLLFGAAHAWRCHSPSETYAVSRTSSK